MFKKIEVSCIEKAENSENLKKITEILADGVYEYLKKNGYLREDTERSERIRTVLEKAKEACNQDGKEIEEKESEGVS